MSQPASDLEDELSDWEIEEGLPQFDDPFIQKYFSGREALMERERSQRSDTSFQQSLSPIAKEACNIVSEILKEERQTTLSSHLQDETAPEQSFKMHPGMAFRLARTVMEETKTWQILKRMPKGGLLHAHLDATMDVDFIIAKALATQGMTIAASEPLLDIHKRQPADIKFRFAKSTEQHGALIWTKDYQALQPVWLQEAAESFPATGRDGFVDWLKTQVSISPDQTLKYHHGPEDIWETFTSCFPRLNSLESYEPVFRASLRHLLENLAQDGVQWVDFRAPFFGDYYVEGSEEPSPDAGQFLETIEGEVDEFRKTKAGSDFWGCRFIWTCLRAWSKREIVSHMKACVIMKKQFPKLICGFDCVGYEVAGRTLADLAPELFWFKKHCAENEVDIPFFFHAGECFGSDSEADANLFDAILLGSRRIGHGFSLANHPLLTEMIKTKRILIESCPISNEILRLNSSIKAHPLPALLARGVACCLANDDPGIFRYGTTGVTPDFWQALQGWDIGLDGLGSLAENSVRWACYEDQSAAVWNKDVADGKYGQGIRAQRMEQWRQVWDRFCEEIVREYGVKYGGDL